MLVLGVHARYSFATAAEEEVYKEFCELCARGNVQPECVNFKAKPLCSRPVPSFHPIDEKTDTMKLGNRACNIQTKLSKKRPAK